MNSIVSLITCLTHLIVKRLVTVFGDHVSINATLSVFGTMDKSFSLESSVPIFVLFKFFIFL